MDSPTRATPATAFKPSGPGGTPTRRQRFLYLTTDEDDLVNIVLRHHMDQATVKDETSRVRETTKDGRVLAWNLPCFDLSWKLEYCMKLNESGLVEPEIVHKQTVGKTGDIHRFLESV